MKVTILLYFYLVLCITSTLGICDYSATNQYCQPDDVNTNDFWTCSGVTKVDDFESSVTSNKYCAPTSGTFPSDSPCLSLYNYPSGVRLCWPYSASGIIVSSWSLQAWNSQVNTVNNTLSRCKDGTIGKIWPNLLNGDLQKSGNGYACCQTWYDLELNINWCHSLSCWCPIPCTATPTKVTKPITTYTYEANGFCYSDCTDCANIGYGARSTSICDSGSLNSGTTAIASSSSCNCCRQFNGTTSSGNSRAPVPSASTTSVASRTSNPSSSLPPAASRTSNPSASSTSVASRTSNPSSSLPPAASRTSNPSASASRLPVGASASRSSFPSASRFPGGSSMSKTALPSASRTPGLSPSFTKINGTILDTSDDSASGLSKGAIAGIAVGSVAGGLCILFVILAIVAVVLVIILKKRGRDSFLFAGSGSTPASPSMQSYPTSPAMYSTSV